MADAANLKFAKVWVQLPSGLLRYPPIATWDRKLESDVNLDSAEWEWLKPHLADVMAQVEKWDVFAKLLSVHKLGYIVFLRAHYPDDMQADDEVWVRIGCPGKAPTKYEEERWCTECRCQVKSAHDLNECMVRRVMGS